MRGRPSRAAIECMVNAVNVFPAFIRSPAERQGDEKLVYRLIQLFSSTEIFSKRRKICTCWRKTRVIARKEVSEPCLTWCCKTCGTNNLTTIFLSMRKRHTLQKDYNLRYPMTRLLRMRLIPVPRPIRFFFATSVKPREKACTKTQNNEMKRPKRNHWNE